MLALSQGASQKLQLTEAAEVEGRRGSQRRGHKEALGQKKKNQLKVCLAQTWDTWLPSPARGVHTSGGQ